MNMFLSNKLKNIRKVRKYTQKDTAQLLGIPITKYRLIEHGQKEPNEETIQKLAEIFDVAKAFFLGCSGEGDPEGTSLSSPFVSGIFSPKDIKEIDADLKKMEKQLRKNKGLMFDGEPATPETILKIINAIKFGMQLADKDTDKE